MKNNANLVILIIGSVFVILGSFLGGKSFVKMGNAYRFKSEAVSVEGVITDIEVEKYRSGNETRTRYHISVDYVIDGVKYENIVNRYRSSMHIGGEITLYYLQNEPWTVKSGSKDTDFWGAIVIGMGGLIFIFAGFHFLNSIRKKNELQKFVKQWGKTIYAEVIAVEKDYSVSVNFGFFSRSRGNHPYSYLKCVVKKPGTDDIQATYNSCSVNYDLLSYVGKQVKVYLHPHDNSKYYVDLEELIGK